MSLQKIIFLSLLIIAAPVANSQQIQDEILRSVAFSDVDAAREAAIAADAATYSPKNFTQAEKMYADANRDLQRNRKMDRIRSKLTKATETFRNAAQTATLLKSELAPMLKSRSDAQSVEAENHDERNWRQGEKYYQDAIRLFERGRSESAQKRAGESESQFRAAELTAIKAAYLDEARRLLAEAESIRADRFAALTFEKAANLIDEAERELTGNRYDIDRPRDLARQAEYEARHAIFLSRAVENAKKEKTTLETHILAGELPLQKIAAETDLNVSFDSGYEEATRAILSLIRSQENQMRVMEQQMFDRDGQIEALREQIVVLENRYGSVANQRKILEEQLAEQERKRERFRYVESLFSEEQADVIRTGDDIMIRLIGNTFEVSKARIEPDSYEILSRVIEAILTYPDAQIRIEGHTDSYGGDSINMELSVARANAVKAYLLANMAIDQLRIEAEGFGEVHPISNNETPEGRARNRRIDVVINPYTMQ